MDPLIELRLDLLRDMGIIITDTNYFIKITNRYGYHEVVWQYLDHFIKRVNKESITFKHPTTFEEIYNFYCLDQHLKNQVMISLQLFEQSFKVALAEISFLGKNRQLAKNINPQTKQPRQFLKEKYQLKNRHVIRRGDVKSRIRHIKQNYLEPYDGYREVAGEATYWVIFKEMSFGVATNYFFLMPIKCQKQVLARVFKSHITLRKFEKWLETIRYFQRRAAHNYRPLGIKVGRQFLYQKISDSLYLLQNLEPRELLKQKIPETIDEYLGKYPYEKEFLSKNLECCD